VRLSEDRNSPRAKGTVNFASALLLPIPLGAARSQRASQFQFNLHYTSIKITLHLLTARFSATIRQPRRRSPSSPC